MSARNKEKYEGVVFYNKQGREFKVLQYVNAFEIYIRFTGTGYETKAKLQHIKDGAVKDKLSPTVQGVGIVGNELISINRKAIKEYNIWFGMLNRCYSSNPRERNKTYLNCTVSENFKFYPYFKEWCNNQIGFNSVDENGKPFALDKDILIKDNRVYNEYSCVFVPSEINSLLAKQGNKRGDCVVGVRKYKDKFIATVSTGKRVQDHLGIFKTEKDAFQAYKTAKEAHIEEIANKWKDQIDPRVYKSLMNYEVHIDD